MFIIASRNENGDQLAYVQSMKNTTLDYHPTKKNNMNLMQSFEKNLDYANPFASSSTTSKQMSPPIK